MDLHQTVPEYPVLRPVDVFPVDVQGNRVICLRDVEGHADNLIFLPPFAMLLASLMDGKHSAADIAAIFAEQTGHPIAVAQIEKLVSDLDANLMLDSPRFQAIRAASEAAFFSSPVRPLAHGGRAYEADPVRLRETLDGYLAVPAGGAASGRLRALISPHIDYQRGGSCYGLAYHALRQQQEPFDLLCILGTSHAMTRRLFTATLKHYDTPLGPVETDQEFMRSLMDRYPFDLLDDELVHRNEHAIELQTIFIKHLFPDLRIAPILVGSFHHFLQAGISPWQVEAVREFVAAMQATVQALGRRVCYVAAADLAHIGTRFGDAEPASDELMAWVAAEDALSLEEARAVRPEGWFDRSVQEQDRRRICGLSPIYTMLRLLDADSQQGQLLAYRQCNEPTGANNVTIASVAYYDKT